MSEVQRREIRVLVGSPVRDEVKTGFAFDLARMLADTAAQFPEIEIRQVFNKNTILAEQRHEIVGEASVKDMTHILWLDSDMRFPRDTLIRLLNHDKDYVAANYVKRRIPIEPVALQLSEDGKRFDSVWTEESSHGLQQVFFAPLGVAMTKVDVFRKLPAPWFNLLYWAKSADYAGEDVFFAHHCKANGIECFIDHDLSKEIGHLGEFEFRHEHAAAMRAAPRIEIVSA